MYAPSSGPTQLMSGSSEHAEEGSQGCRQSLRPSLKSAQSEWSSATYADLLSLRQNQRSLEQRNNFILTSLAAPTGR